jgi:hypothetical protein
MAAEEGAPVTAYASAANYAYELLEAERAVLLLLKVPEQVVERLASR